MKCPLKKRIGLIFILLVGLYGSDVFSQDNRNNFSEIRDVANSRKGYIEDPSGNPVPDFSYCGYMAGDEPVPEVPVRIVVPLTDGDATKHLQNAIDYLAKLAPDANGFRGAALLLPGEYKIAGQLIMNASGIVLRGSGMGKNGTRLIATGKDRRTLIRMEGINDRMNAGDTLTVADEFVPVNAHSLTVSGRHILKAGDKVTIRRPSTKEWIDALGAAHFGGGITSLGWKPGERDIFWDRTVTSVNGNLIGFDAPLTTALDWKYGGGFVIPYTWKGRISKIGIENLDCVSEYDVNNKKDEAHSWMAITMANVSDAWVRNITFRHFAGSAVFILETGNRITVENCKSLEPVSEIGGQRRYTFHTMGQQCLFQRLYSEYGYHDFSLGFCAPGPNAFVQCHAHLPYSFSGPVGSWASGVLFDIVNIDGNALSYKNLGQDGQGAGWNAANSVFWQCAPSRLDCFAPPTAMNWAYGSWSEFSGDGFWAESNNHIRPRSLYYALLQDRLGTAYQDRSDLIPIPTSASTSPTIQLAKELTEAAVEPAITLYDWIDKVVAGHPLSIDPSGIKALPVEKTTASVAPAGPASSLAVHNGWLVRMDPKEKSNVSARVETGFKYDIIYWGGSTQPAYLEKVKRPHLTRFVPGRTGIGLTDDLNEVAEWMSSNNILAMDHHYGLWYERRRDDHERIRRMNGDVWAPFYELPFARVGEGTELPAFDGLSKYDLTKYNDWYWMRLKQFAEIADRKNLILMNQNYFQHNIIEAGAHWADFPWRAANNINNTGFPEPVPYAGDKRVFMGEQFYDIDNPQRRELHRAYIRQCLNNFRGTGSVIQLISEEFTGPLHFVRFWFDVIAEWEKETGEQTLVALSTTKDVQDAILADPVRAALVDIIDIRYWFYRNDTTTYEPLGGQNLAPRQHARLTAPGRASFESVYRAVSEYRNRFPEKAVSYYSTSYPQYGWASFMAGGSLACLPEIKDDRFLSSVSGMKVLSGGNGVEPYVLGNKDKGYVVFSENEQIELDLKEARGNFELYRIHAQTGSVTKDRKQIKGGYVIQLENPGRAENVLWLVKK